MARYSGKNLYVSFNGTAISPVRSITIDDESPEIDATAAADTRGVFVSGVPLSSWSVEAMDDDTTDTTFSALQPGTSGSLIVAPQGTATGKKKISYTDAIALKRSRATPYADVVMVTASGRVNASETLGTY